MPRIPTTTGLLLALCLPLACGDTGKQPEAAGTSAPTAAAPTSTAPATTPPPGRPPTQERSQPQGAGIPPLVADPAKVDFGIVEPGSELSTTVTLLNPTARPVRILKAQPSCTCTTVDMTNVIIPARSTVEMPISMKTSRAVGKKPARVQLMVQGYNKFFTIDIDAETAWAVRAIPPHLPVKEKATGPEQLQGRYALESVDKRPFSVLSVMSEPPEFDGFDPGSDAPRNRYILKYDFSHTPCEEIPPFIIIRTDHPLAPLLDVRVRHDPCTRIAPPLPMGDYRSNLGVVKPGQALQVPLTFKKLRRPKIESVRSLGPILQTDLIDQRADGKELETITLARIAQDAPEGLFQVQVVYSDGVTSAEHTYYGWVDR